MSVNELGEWKNTVLVIVTSIAISSTLPLWLRLAKYFDVRKQNLSNTGDADESEIGGGGGDDTDGEGQVWESSVASDDHYSTFSTVTSQISAVLEARPRRTAGRRGDRRKRRRERDIRYAAELSKLSAEENPCEVGAEIEVGDFSCAKSVMSKLSVDDISMNGSEIKSAHARTDIVREQTRWEKLLEISEWEYSLATLSGFYMVQGVVENITEIAQVALIGHMIGTAEANVYMMTHFLIEMTSLIGVGYQEAIGVLVPHADGVGNDLLAGRYLQIGLFFSVISQLPGFLFWFFYMHDTILWFNFDEQTAAIAQGYTYSIFIYFLAEGMNECLLEFLDVGDHEKYVTIFTVIQACVSSGIIVAMASLGVSNMVAIGLTQSLVRVTLLLLNFCFVANKGWFSDFSEGLYKTFGLKDLRAMWTTFVTAIPLSVAWILSYGEWQVMIVFAQSIGPDQVAAWNILGYIWDFFESITEAIGSAAEVRVGFRMGAGKPQLAKKMSEKSIYFGTLFAVYTAGGLFVLAQFLPSWLTPNLIYQKLVFDQIPLIGFGGILMVPGLVMESILCAQGRVRLMTVIEVVVSWFIAIPLAAILVYSFHSGLEGLVTGLVIGYSTGATILFFFILRSNWEQLSKMVIEKNSAEGARYLDTDWDELPSEVKAAASTLGYNKSLWESGKEPESTGKGWNTLTKAEQAAAKVLGYNKKKWNGESDRNDYEEYDFDDLPPDVRKAAKFLGYTSAIWDKDGKVPLEKKDWAELTREQQDAASILGYTEEKWNDDSDSDSSSSSSEESRDQLSKMMPSIPEDRQVNYENMDFKELPSEVRKAAKFLGYTSAIWDKDGKVPIESKDWSKLTKKQQKAASTLGYTQEKWDNESDSSSSSSESSVAPDEKDVDYEDMDFKELPSEVRKAAKFLGYTSAIWDKDGKVPIESKDWSKLTKKQQKAASTLGYTQEKWDGESDSSSSSSSESSVASREKMGDYQDIDFDQLPAKMKKAAKALGYTRAIWNKDEKVPIEDKNWSELTENERHAAYILGYTEEKWNNESDSDLSSSSPPCKAKEKEMHYDGCSFDKLPKDVKNAATALGHNDSTWDKGVKLPIESKDWSALTVKEQEAAFVLGHTKEKWNAAIDSQLSLSDCIPWGLVFGTQGGINLNDGIDAINTSICSRPWGQSQPSGSPNAESRRDYAGYKFDQLPPEIRQAAMTTGFTRYTWDNKTFGPKKSRTWDSLSPKEKAAASSLGFTAEKWEALLDSW